MNLERGQLEEALRQEMEANSRLRHLISAIAKDAADIELRHLYKTNDAASIIRGMGIAEGIEKLANLLTTITKQKRRSNSGIAAESLL